MVIPIMDVPLFLGRETVFQVQVIVNNIVSKFCSRYRAKIGAGNLSKTQQAAYFAYVDAGSQKISLVASSVMDRSNAYVSNGAHRAWGSI